MNNLPLAASGQSAVDVARAAASLAAGHVRAVFGNVDSTRSKGNRDVVTDVDLAIERAVRDLISAEFPGHAFLGEESAAKVRSDGWMWVLDPVDGTKNFSLGIPHFAFSLALCLGSEPVMGIITHPIAGEEYLAVKGDGFAVNGRRIDLDEKHLADAVISIDLGFRNESGLAQLELAHEAWQRVQGIRTMGSAALGLAFVAAGRFDAYVHPSLEAWDLAAGLLLVREAGGIVTNFAGEPATIFTGDVVAARPGVHAEMVALLTQRSMGGGLAC